MKEIANPTNHKKHNLQLEEKGSATLSFYLIRTNILQKPEAEILQNLMS
ncbi:hypothetical protein [uncultured Desulfobacter sp.]|nr:hypothetical protein [uncultured Desulfobacter sp.]